MIFRAAARNHGHSEDMTILKNIRPYQPGDPMKRINWRHLAGSGRMEVNVYEAIMPGGICPGFMVLQRDCRENRKSRRRVRGACTSGTMYGRTGGR